MKFYLPRREKTLLLFAEVVETVLEGNQPRHTDTRLDEAYKALKRSGAQDGVPGPDICDPDGNLRYWTSAAKFARRKASAVHTQWRESIFPLAMWDKWKGFWSRQKEFIYASALGGSVVVFFWSDNPGPLIVKVTDFIDFIRNLLP